MDQKDIIRIINEEIQEFDFLGTDEAQNEQDYSNYLSDRNFQTQFVYDVINSFNDKTKFKDEDVTYKRTSEDDILDKETLNIDYGVDITYIYDGKDIRLSLNFDGDSISHDLQHYDQPATYETPPEGDIWYNSIDWSDIDLNIFDDDGNEVNFDWLKSNQDMYNKFISAVISPILDIKIGE